MTPEDSKPSLPESLTSFLDTHHFTKEGLEKRVLVPEAAPPEEPPSRKHEPQPYDFRNPMLLSARELRKLRIHQEEFVESLAARLSIHLRTEFALSLSGLQTMTYQKMATTWAYPTHLTLFKMEPLRGISIIEVSNHLGACMVDRLMGGPGQALPTVEEISEIEKVLLEQTVELVLEEWCNHWKGIKDLKPSILGYENNGRFVQTVPAETIMLVISLKADFGERSGRMQLGFPFAALEPLIHHFSQGAETMTPAAPATPPPAAVKWNSCFDEVRVPLTAEWDGLELTARQVLALKVGDILPLDSKHAQQINVRLADVLKFQGRPGKTGGQWAVELTNAVKRQA
jgi:flagellar motor switch protein FliM